MRIVTTFLYHAQSGRRLKVNAFPTLERLAVELNFPLVIMTTDLCEGHANFEAWSMDEVSIFCIGIMLNPKG